MVVRVAGCTFVALVTLLARSGVRLEGLPELFEA